MTQKILLDMASSNEQIIIIIIHIFLREQKSVESIYQMLTQMLH